MSKVVTPETRMQRAIEYGDCLDVMKQLRAAGLLVDLIVTDPPFNSGRDYNLTIDKSVAQQDAYTDTFSWDQKSKQEFRDFLHPQCKPFLQALVDSDRISDGLLAYLVNMALRLEQMVELLKTTGSIYLHCDPTASHYLKILLDLLGMTFRNEIIWKRKRGAHNNRKGCGAIHDVILFYSKSDVFTWNTVRHLREIPAKTKKDPDGRQWHSQPLHGHGSSKGPGSAPWKGVVLKNRHWAIPDSLSEQYKALTGKELVGTTPQEKLDQLDEAGLILWPDKEGGVPRYKKYIEAEDDGAPLQDLWVDIHALTDRSEEWEDFGGQKPVALVERMILASSNVGDHVLDPFLGSGTTAIAASRQDRRWTGIDLTRESARIAHKRLDAEFGEESYIRVNDFPLDMQAAIQLATKGEHNKDAWYTFQCWAVKYLNGIPRSLGSDRGIDGDFWVKGLAGAPLRGGIQVKSNLTSKVDRRDIQNFAADLKRNNLTFGLFVCFNDRIVKGARDAVNEQETFRVSLDLEDKRSIPMIEFVTVENMLDATYGGPKVGIVGFVPTPDLSEHPLHKKRVKRLEDAEEAAYHKDIQDSLEDMFSRF